MAVPELITTRELTRSRFGQLVEAADNINIPTVVARAEAVIQSQLHRKLKRQQYVEYSRPRGNTLFLRQRPVIEITSVERRGLGGVYATMDLSTLLLESQAGYIVGSTSFADYYVRVTYEAGYDDIPEDIKEAIIIQCALFITQDLEIYGAGDGKPPGILYMQKDIDRLLAPHKQSVMV